MDYSFFFLMNATIIFDGTALFRSIRYIPYSVIYMHHMHAGWPVRRTMYVLYVDNNVLTERIVYPIPTTTDWFPPLIVVSHHRLHL